MPTLETTLNLEFRQKNCSGSFITLNGLGLNCRNVNMYNWINLLFYTDFIKKIISYLHHMNTIAFTIQ